MITTPRGFEPLRAEPNGFRVHLLSRSDTVSYSTHIISVRGSWPASLSQTACGEKLNRAPGPNQGPSDLRSDTFPTELSRCHHCVKQSISTPRKTDYTRRPQSISSISGLVVEYIVAIDVTRVRFPADASCRIRFSLSTKLVASGGHWLAPVATSFGH